DDGNIVIKVFQIQEAKAQDIYDRLDPSKPEYARMTVDVNSNQIIVESDIGYAKRVARLINILDVEPYVAVKVETFRLRYADASTVAELIETLFASSGTSSSPQVNRTASRGQNRNTNQRTAQQQATVEVGTSEQLTVTVLEQTNSITVRAEPDILGEIRGLLDTAWDVAPAEEGELFRIYDLMYTDPIKVKELLVSLLESGGTSSAGNARGNNRGGNNSTSGADAAVANIFKIEAYPDSNRLIVISKSPSNFEWLDQMIEKIDMPLSVGMPINIELKHASAVGIAEILNALLAEAGGSASISAPDEGLSGINFDVAGEAAGGSNNVNTTGGSSEATINFPWQSSRGAAGEAAEVSALVGKARVVPNAAQNSLLVLATPEIQSAVVEIIEELDRPGRQVMIQVVLAEVELGDQFEFGLRFGQNLSPNEAENAVVITGAGANGSTMFSGFMDNLFVPPLTQGILDFNVDANVILQALDQVTNTRILQSPRLFTSDNQEAVFFDGSDVPVQTGSTAVAGQLTTTDEYRSVGIGLNVRPRITKERNVAMQIEVLLSNIDRNSPAGVNNNPVFKRRQTNTSVTIKNGQTIVISGIRKESEGKKTNKVPLLGDIPVLDWVFSNESDETSISELVLFVTPIVVDNPDENDINFNEVERRRLETFKDPIGERMRDLQNQLGIGINSGGPANRDPRRD
ncbi:MAG: secretin N-terminal domain-containing protein, partial [Planctomycetota bacterium]|nr:secretin N-terminal domain-containing protein [Planctomycetota bacterium]